MPWFPLDTDLTVSGILVGMAISALLIWGGMVYMDWQEERKSR